MDQMNLDIFPMHTNLPKYDQHDVVVVVGVMYEMVVDNMVVDRAVKMVHDDYVHKCLENVNLCHLGYQYDNDNLDDYVENIQEMDRDQNEDHEVQDEYQVMLVDEEDVEVMFV
jgi:hypothetical protein